MLKSSQSRIWLSEAVISLFQYRIGRSGVISTSHKQSRTRIRIWKYSNRSEIWQASLQPCCPNAHRFSKRYKIFNAQTRRFEALRDLMKTPQIARFMGPTWGPPGSCRPQMGPMLAPWGPGTLYRMLKRIPGTRMSNHNTPLEYNRLSIYRGTILHDISHNADILRYNITRYFSQCNIFEVKASARLRTHERHPYLAFPGDLWLFFVSYRGNDREVSGVHYRTI